MLFQDYNIIVDDKKLVAYWPVWMDDIRDSVTIEAKIEPDVKVTISICHVWRWNEDRDTVETYCEPIKDNHIVIKKTFINTTLNNIGRAKIKPALVCYRECHEKQIRENFYLTYCVLCGDTWEKSDCVLYNFFLYKQEVSLSSNS